MQCIYLSPPDDRCVQAFVPHGVRKAPTPVSPGQHWRRHWQTPLLPLRDIKISRSGVSFPERGSFFCCDIFTFSLSVTFIVVSPAVLGGVWSVAVIQQPHSIPDDRSLWHRQPPRVSLLWRGLWTCKCFTHLKMIIIRMCGMKAIQWHGPR